MFKIKLFSTFYVIMKMQIKATMENTAHLLEWPMSRTQKHQVLLRIWSNRNSHSWLIGMKNGIAILKDKSVAPYKINHTLTI